MPDTNGTTTSNGTSYEEIALTDPFELPYNITLNPTETIEQIYQKAVIAAKYIETLIGPIKPTIGIICGSGLSSIGDIITQAIRIPYDSIPGMSHSKVQGHNNIIVAGLIGDKMVICFQGRLHYYEGFPMSMVVLPVRIMKFLGVQELIVTNSSGRLKSDYNLGDVMVIKDHINFLSLSGQNPLRGDNDPRFGERFPGMIAAYDKILRWKCKRAFFRTGLDGIYREGVYCCVPGPSYETPAELKFLRDVGADAIGMSTGPEVTTARHCGIKVCGLSLITNLVQLDVEDSVDEMGNLFENDVSINNASNGTYNTKHNGEGQCSDKLVDNDDFEISHEKVLEVATSGVINMARIIKELISDI